MRLLEPPATRQSSELLIAGLWCESRSEIEELWDQFESQRESIPNQIDGYCYGVTLNAEKFEYIAGVAVTSDAKLPKNLATVRSPARTYAVYKHRGPTGRLRESIDAIWEEREPVPFAVRSFIRFLDPLPPGASVEIWIPA